MTTSGTAIFNPDVAELIEESYERIGYEGVTGYDVRTARRSLNLLSLEWANRQVNLWTILRNSDSSPFSSDVHPSSGHHRPP